MNRHYFVLATLLPLVSLACETGETDDIGAITQRSGALPTTFVGGPGNAWTEGTPYLSYYIDLRCNPGNGCEVPPGFDTVLYDLTSEDALVISGSTDAENGLPNGVSYEKHIAGGDWVPLAAPYAVTLNTPYLDGQGNQVEDDGFRIKRQFSNPWSYVNDHWETSSTWVRFPRPNGDPFTPVYNLTYTLQECGNGEVEGAEACDDGNTQSEDGCSNTCTIEWVCGDSILSYNIINGQHVGEECDDGNTQNGDGCSSSCAIEWVCGDGMLSYNIINGQHVGEECDDGNTQNGDGCSSSCAIEWVCGDGMLSYNIINGQHVGEECDDGNTQNGDGCSSTCAIEPAVCGDGVLQGDEECDDGNDIGDDGCEFCELKTSTGLVYARANSLFWQFSEATNAWTARANVPAASNTTLTNDGQFVYSLLMAEAANVPDPNKRNHIFKYDRTQDTWSDHMVGPPYTLDVGGSAGSDLLEWVEDGFVLVNNWYKKENQVITRGVEVWVYQNGAWELKTNIPDVRMFGHGGWDRMSDRIHMTYSHINEASLHGVFTIETGANFATSVHNDPGGMVPKSLPNGSISRGSFFRWEHSGYEMRRYSPTNWSYSGTGKYVSGNVAATDHGDGDIFILSTDTIPNAFSRYSVQSGNLTTGLPVPSIGTPVLTVLRPL